MNYPLYFFAAFSFAILIGAGYFMRKALSSISSQAGEHAKLYARSYVKGGSLMFIGATVTFDQAYYALGVSVQANMAWAPYVIFFCKPVSAALTVLVGFLDHSIQKATEDAKVKAGVNGANTPDSLA